MHLLVDDSLRREQIEVRFAKSASPHVTSMKSVRRWKTCLSTLSEKYAETKKGGVDETAIAFRGLSAILFKEFIIVLRDRRLLLHVLSAAIEMIAFGYALDTDVKHMAMVVLNEDRTVESRQFIDRFVNTETFRVAAEVQSIDEMASLIRRGDAYAGLPNSTEIHLQNLRNGDLRPRSKC